MRSIAALFVAHNRRSACSNDPRYIIEKDAVGRFTLTITNVEEADQAEWTAYITDDVQSKCQVYVEEPRDTFVVPLKSQRAGEREKATFECDVNASVSSFGLFSNLLSYWSQ